MVFGRVKPDVFEKLLSSYEGASPGTRCGYNYEKEHLIITVYPSQIHEAFVNKLKRTPAPWNGYRL